MAPTEDFIPSARPVIGEREIEAAVRVLRSGMVVQGPEVAAFEQEFSDLVDGRHCVAVNSGTSALQLTLLALGLGPGDEVIVPSFSFAATRERGPAGRRHAGLRRHRGRAASASTRTRSRRRSRRAPWRSCRCTCTATRPRWTGSWRSPTGTGSPIVEDAAQAHGAALDGKPVGAFGVGRLLQLLPDQEHALARGRHDHHRRRRASPAPCACCATRAWSSGTPTRSSAPTCGSPTSPRRSAGSSSASSPAGPSSAGRTPKYLDSPDHRRGHAAGRRRRPARLPPVHGPGPR